MLHIDERKAKDDEKLRIYLLLLHKLDYFHKLSDLRACFKTQNKSTSKLKE